MMESFASLSSFLKPPFVAIYLSYLYTLYRLYHWMLKNSKPRYVQKPWHLGK